MRIVPLLILLLLPAAPAGAQEIRVDQAGGAIATAIVPVVGNVFGAGMTRWKATVELVNDTGAPVDVAIELPAAPEFPMAFFSLAPGQVQRFGDIMGEAFALDGVISPLRIVTGGRRSVTVRTYVYPVVTEGSPPMQEIPAYYAPEAFPVRVLDGLTFSDDERTNIGLVNLSDAPADFLLALQRIPGRSVAVTHVRVAPSSIHHEAIQFLFPLITKGSGFSVVIESGTPDTYVYASVVENATSRGRYVGARPGLR